MQPRFVCHEASTLTAETAAALYQRDQLLWIRLPEPERAACSSFSPGLNLHRLNQAHPKAVSSRWSVENAGSCCRSELQPGSLLSSPTSLLGGRWYVSAVLQRNKAALGSFLGGLPFAAPPPVFSDG